MNSLPSKKPGEDTIREIRQQPETWRDTVSRVCATGMGPLPDAVITGAGTSAYAGMAVASAWPGSIAIGTTELFLDFREPLTERKLVVSLARSGNSPESVAVVEKIQKAMPEVRHIAVTCNAEGKLAGWKGVEAIVLSPLTNDRSLAMTSSFSNLVLGGTCLARLEEVETALPALCEGGETILAEHEATAKELAAAPPARMVVLASAPLFGAARESCLKTLEMTSGRIATMPETYLGLRHGPMSFIQPDTLVVCYISSDPKRRRYEMDLVKELREKKIGRLVALAPEGAEKALFDVVISTAASSLPDYLRTPAEIVFAQLLAYHFSLGFGLDPDNPSPDGVINRVVQGVHIYED